MTKTITDIGDREAAKQSRLLFAFLYSSWVIGDAFMQVIAVQIAVTTFDKTRN